MKKDFSLIYRIDNNDESGINLFELAPLLQNIGDLLINSNKVSHQIPLDLLINVTPFKKGSFIIDMLVLLDNNKVTIFNALQGDGAQYVKDLLALIGIVNGNHDGTSLLNLIRTLKGMIPKITSRDDGKFVYEAAGNTYIINAPVHNLYINSPVRQNINGVYGKPLQTGSVAAIESYLSSDVENSKVVVTKDEAKLFSGTDEVEQPPDDETIQNTTTIFLKPKRLSVEGESDHWSFRKCSGTQDEVITVTMKDEKFLSKVRSGQIPSMNDILKVRLEETQKLVRGNLTMSYNVLEVLEHKITPPQPKLF